MRRLIPYGSRLYNSVPIPLDSVSRLGCYDHSVTYYSFQIAIEKEPEDPGYYAYSPTFRPPDLG